MNAEEFYLQCSLSLYSPDSALTVRYRFSYCLFCETYRGNTVVSDINNVSPQTIIYVKFIEEAGQATLSMLFRRLFIYISHH